MSAPLVIDVAAVVLTPRQVAWIQSLGPDRRRRFDALHVRGWSYAMIKDPSKRARRDYPGTLAFILDVADGGPDVLADPIIAAEVNRILQKELPPAGDEASIYESLSRILSPDEGDPEAAP